MPRQSSRTIPENYYSTSDSIETSVGGSNMAEISYDEVMMGESKPNEPVKALSSRLVSFRNWLEKDAGCTLHPAVCIVNGEATDGTKNAPVLTYAANAAALNSNLSSGRCGVIDNEGERALYERTIGCQVRVARELKKGEIMCSVPRKAMITPELVAKSDAGKAVLACVEGTQNLSADQYWSAFLHSGSGLKKMSDRVNIGNATQLLVKILRERKTAETTLAKAQKEMNDGKQTRVQLCPKGKLSTRAVFLAFLIHQRFSKGSYPAITTSENTEYSENNPKSFGPYTRTLPSTISLPICWKRNELALLSACVSGVATLQEVAANTCLLSSDFCSLIESGILHRFPNVFPKGLITWDRWMWAAATHMSRNFPASLYLNKGEDRAEFAVNGPKPADVWDDLGIMVPLLDMLNHEEESSQILWEQTGENESGESILDPRISLQKRVKKGCQVYNVYSSTNNQELISQYGFALMSNTTDQVSIGFGFIDGVGKVPKPKSYYEKDIISCKTPVLNSRGKTAEKKEDKNEYNFMGYRKDEDYLIYDTTEGNLVNRWWNPDRLRLLENLPNFSEKLMSTLKLGKKLSCTALNDGSYDNVLLSTAIIATMPRNEVTKNIKALTGDSTETKNSVLSLSKRHVRVLRRYLLFYFSQKLEKLLANLNSGLKDHFNYVQLWHKISKGGLFYEGDDGCMSWQTFFDTYAYSAAMEVEKRYYAMGPDSCVLTLYDGHLRAIQRSIEGLLSTENFEAVVLKQIENLGFKIGSEEGEDDVEEIEVKAPSNENVGSKNTSRSSSNSRKDKSSDNNNSGKNSTSKQNESSSNGKNEKSNSSSKSKNSESNRSGRIRRNRKGARPPAIKLHVGNLSYATKPAELFEFFVNKYGRDNVLECHIPTERDTGKSRGFGFVTMPEGAAIQALTSGRVHEIEGRVLKVAQSNTAGSGKNSRNSNNPPITNDRCNKCGYRPRYCDCGNMNMPVHMRHPMDDMRNPPLPPPMPPQDFGGHYGRQPYEPNMYGGGGGGGWHRGQNWNMERRRSRSRSPSLREGRGGRMDDANYYHSYGPDRRSYDRGYRDSRGRSYSRSRSRSISRDRDRGRDRSRHSRSGGRRSSRGSGSGYHRRHSRSRSRSDSRSRSRSWSRSRSRSYGKGPRRGDDAERKMSTAESMDRARSRSRSHSRSSLPMSKGNGEKKRDGKNRNRSRSRSRSRGRRERRKRSKGSSSRKESSKRYNRSRSGNHSPSMSRSRSRSWSQG